MGATDADLERMGLISQEAKAREGITVLAPNETAWRLFLACQNKWHTESPGISGRVIKIGLIGTEVESRAKRFPAIRAMSEEDKDRLWADIDILENAAVACMAEMRDSEQS